jgi:Sigma-70 region 2
LGTEATSATTDSQLVTEARAGDPRAFGQLVRRHAPIARRMAVLWGAGADADDVVQDAFVRAYAGLGLTPPVRAAVVEWLRFGGILIRTAPPVSGPSPTRSRLEAIRQRRSQRRRPR